MSNKKGTGLKARVYKVLKKSLFLCQVYGFGVEMKRLFRHGKVDPVVYIINHNKKLVYIPIAKVANSSIKASMCEQKLDGVKEYYQIHSLVTKTNKLEKEAEKYYKFSFVRNPYDRLVSCYVNKYITDKEDPKYMETKGRLCMDSYLMGYIRRPKDFTDFVRKISRIPTCLEEQHFQKQYNLLYDKKGNCLVDYVGKYENITKDFEMLAGKFDLKPLPHYNQTSKGNWMDYYTLETAELVHKKYRRDFQVFGYEDSYRDLVRYLKHKK